MATNVWVADRRLYLDEAGNVVEANDPTRRSLLVPAGGSIPLADAERYGLVSREEKAAPAKPNKAKTKAPENK